MMRWLILLFGGVLLGGMIHLVTVLALPTIATLDAYSRLQPLTAQNAVTVLPQTTTATALMPYMDPAFAIAICRYDLGAGPLRGAVSARRGQHRALLGRGQRVLATRLCVPVAAVAAVIVPVSASGLVHRALRRRFSDTA